MLVKSILTLLNSRARDQSKPNISRKNLSITAAGRMGEEQVKQAGVLITYNPISYLIETLDIKFQTYKLYEAHDREAFFAEHSQSIRGVVCGGHDGINAQMIDALPCLEIVAVNGVGIDKVDLAKCKQRNIAVTNTPDVLTDDVADLAIALMLDALRQISAADRYVRQGLWQSKGDYKLTCKDQAMYPQSNSVQQDLQQRLHTTGGLLQQQQQQQQSSVEQQKQLLQAQTQRLSDVPTTSVESSGQTGQQNIMDWQEKIYQKLQKLKDMYFPDLRELLQRLSIKCQQPMAADQLEKLKLYRVKVHRMMQYFQVPKHNIPHNFPEDKIDAVEKQIQSVLNSFKPGKPALQQQQLSGKRVGIVGLGRIGSAIAKRAEAFGCSIAYYSRSQKPNVSFTYHSNVIDLAASSDILVVACSLTKDTRHIINKSVLDALGAKGTLVNIGRGALVDEKELVKALLEGRIQGAGLDVFENEPHVPEELYSLENVVLVPHVGSGTWETRKGMADLVVGNLEAHFLEKPLLTPVPL